MSSLFMRLSVIATTLGMAILAGCASTPRNLPQTHKLVQLRTALGVGYMREGELGLARNELARALALDPRDGAANDAMALVEERLREPQKARHYFRRGIAHHPHDGSLQNNYGAFLCGTGHVAEGLRHFRAALHSPLYATPQLADLNMAVCLLKVSNEKAAIHYFHRAQALAPALAAPYYYLAHVRYQQHEYARAKDDLAQYLARARSAHALFLGVRVGRALKDMKFINYCATRLLENYAHTPEARTVMQWQREGRLDGR
ncbi:type IV pilus biogenesis/stability protein PilW [Acidiferrobacter sp.]|uniref:type IV pilus biogenesis/stability protein PilW n=1 Tax=Acidiferrobacter sp. TaxID=1872107 RepID=UPI00261163FF|nr:type IV pilus biogenesis/stability protein PilW [Acidiferrobacter sp.]